MKASCLATGYAWWAPEEVVERRSCGPAPSWIRVVVGQWKEIDKRGYLEIDLDSHSGECAVGEWIWTRTGRQVARRSADKLKTYGGPIRRLAIWTWINVNVVGCQTV